MCDTIDVNLGFLALEDCFYIQFVSGISASAWHRQTDPQIEISLESLNSFLISQVSTEKDQNASGRNV